MADISSIKMPNGSIYDLKDKNAQTKINVSGILEGDGQGGISESDILDYDTDTTSGSVVSFTADGVAPLKALTLSIDPVQDLHGYDNPWPSGGGKNKLVPVVPGGSITWNDVTLSVQNGELSLNGKPTTSGGRTSLRTSSFTLPAGTYIISCITTQFVLHDTSDNIIANTLGTASFTLTEETTVYAGFNVIANTQYSGVLKAQIESGSTATTYAPYSNLCPISGWSVANVWRTGKNLLDLSFLEFDDSTYAHDYYPATTPQVSEYAQLMARFVGKTIVLSASITGTQSAGAQPVGSIRLANSGGDVFRLNPNTPTTVPDMDYSNVSYLIIYGSVNGASVSDIQLELSSTPSSYAPYTGTTATIQLGQTVYGGNVDVTSGVLRVTHASKTYSGGVGEGWAKSIYNYFTTGPISDAIDENAKAENFKSNIFPYGSIANNTQTLGACLIWRSVRVRIADMSISVNDWKDLLSAQPMQVVYKLATPLEYTLTPQQLDTLAGQNVMWGDCGDVTVEYRKGENALLQDISEAIKNLQGKIRVSGLLKGDGNGNVTAAVAGTDYITGMYIASYGKSTYAEVLAAYQANKIIYCRASSNSNPAVGNQLRMAFLAYVNSEATPTTFEFQYYRSIETHSDSQQGDQVYIYKINSAGTWQTSVREAYTKVVAGTNMSSSYSSGKITLAANDVSIVYTTTLAAASWSDTTPSTYTYSNTALKCGRLGTTPPLILCTSNTSEYSNITSALATAGTGIVFTTDTVPENAIDITIVDFQ